MLAKTNQALATLQTYRSRLEQVLTRLTALEFQNAVALDDVLIVLQRAELTTRTAEEVERDCVELGSEARLIRMQLVELLGDVPTEKAAVVNDYHVAGPAPRRWWPRGAVGAIATTSCSTSSGSPTCSATPGTVNPLDHWVTPRGYRVLAHIPRLPTSVIKRVVADLEGPRRDRPRLAARPRGGGRSRRRAARDIREGLRRLQEHNLVDRYLQL